MGMQERRIGIYIHIPFCVKKCLYCDFLSAPADEETKERYVKALLREMDTFRNETRAGRIIFTSEDGRKVETEWTSVIVDSIFIGGGTPSVINPIYINEILCKLKEILTVEDSAEITMECNPGTVTEEALEIYREAGINRLSFGLQSCNNEELKALGRIHTYEDFLQSYRLAREAGFTNINVDLISAIPGQTWEGFRDSLTKVMDLKPEHISVYSLIVEEGTPFYQMELELPDEETERLIYEGTGELLLSKGYRQYEISNYAREGCECRHNMKYWRRREYLGFGLGASSFIRIDNVKCVGREDGNQEDVALEDVTGCRFKMTSDLSEYLKGDYQRRDVELLSRKDAMGEFMFLGLRMNEGVSEEDFMEEFGCQIEDVFGEAVRKHMDEGLLKQEVGRLALTKQGRNVANYVFCDFIL